MKLRNRIIDSSIAPYCRWSDKGGYIDFFGVPTQPYYPDINGFKKKGNLSILEVPVTVGNTWYEYFPKSILKTVPKYPSLWALPKKIFRNQFKPFF